jgi:prephenate dehydratase
MTHRVAIQGEEGSNSAHAARLLRGADVALVTCTSFDAAFAALDGAADAAVLPFESSTVGTLGDVVDRVVGLKPGPALAIRGEARVPITFVVACLPGARAQVRRVLAHPVAAAQCRRFLDDSGWEIERCTDTAASARHVREDNRVAVAALCPPGVAATYGLEVLAHDCGDERVAVTRFWQLERGAARPRDDDNRTVLAVTPARDAAVLLPTLHAFASRGIALCGIQARVVPGQPGRCVHVLELAGGALHAGFAAAIDDVTALGCAVRVIGSFRAPAWPIGPLAQEVEAP